MQAKQLGISDLRPFLSSDLFAASGFTYDAKTRLILHDR